MSWFSSAVRSIARNDPTARLHTRALNSAGLSQNNTLRRVVDPISVQQERIQNGAPITSRTVFDPGNELQEDPNPARRAERQAIAGYQQAFDASSGAPIPTSQSPGSTSVNIPGYGPAPVTYGPGLGEAAFNGTPPPTGDGWRLMNTRPLISGLLSQQMNQSMTPEQWQGLLSRAPGTGVQPASSFQPAGPYATQAMRMAGTYSQNTPPGDTYPNGLLGGKSPFRPGGK